MRARVKQPEVLVAYGQWHVDSDSDTDPVTVETDPVTGVQYGILHTHTTQMRVNDGDYVIKYADGTLTACNPADFAEKYEVIDLADRVNTPKKLPKSVAPSKGDE